MKADALLSRLEKVRPTGRGTWLACCPAHADKSPSLSLRETEDGRVLIHCFAGCGADDVTAAVGLTLSDLFSDSPLWHRKRPERRPFPAADVLEALSRESLIVSLAALDMARGRELPVAERDRLIAANSRIQEGRDLTNG